MMQQCYVGLQSEGTVCDIIVFEAHNWLFFFAACTWPLGENIFEPALDKV